MRRNIISLQMFYPILIQSVEEVVIILSNLGIVLICAQFNSNPSDSY